MRRRAVDLCAVAAGHRGLTSTVGLRPGGRRESAPRRLAVLVRRLVAALRSPERRRAAEPSELFPVPCSYFYSL